MAAENERVLRNLLAGIKAKVDATEAAFERLRTQQRVLEQLLAEEMGSLPTGALDTPSNDAACTTDHITPTDEGVHVLTGEEEQWQGLKITKAVTRVLDEASSPLSPAQIVAYLNSVGLAQKNSESVRGALSWLRRKGTARMLEYAQWVLVGGSVDQRLRDEAPTTSTSSLGDSDTPESPNEETPTTTEAGGDERYALHHGHRASVEQRHGDSDHQTPIMRAVR